MAKLVYPKSKIVAWWYNPNGGEDPTLPHQYVPNRPVCIKHLEELGVLTWNLDADNWENNEMLEQIKKERGYNYWDVATVSRETMADFDEKVRHFFTEHLHADQEIRLVLEGGGYFDIRNYDEKWIRFRISKGDLIVLPPGMYHRFTMDSNNYVKAVRLFKGLPCWTQDQRPANHMEARRVYMENVLNCPGAIYKGTTTTKE